MGPRFLGVCKEEGGPASPASPAGRGGSLFVSEARNGNVYVASNSIRNAVATAATTWREPVTITVTKPVAQLSQNGCLDKQTAK